MTDPYWRTDAACRDHPAPDLWFHDDADGPETKAARKICAGCPVSWQCGEAAIEAGERWSVVAGHHTKFGDQWDALLAAHGRSTTGETSRRRRTACCARCGETYTTRVPGVTLCTPCRQNLVPAGPVREAIERLRVGRTLQAIAAGSGVHRTHLQAIQGRSKWVRHGTAKRITDYAAAELARSA